MKCKKFKEKIILYLYGELGEREINELKTHMKDCVTCSSDLEYTKRVFQLIDKSKREDIPEAKWDQCWQGINAALGKAGKKRPNFFSLPRWAYASAAFIAVLTIGIFLGRYVFFPYNKVSLRPTISQNYGQYSLQEHLEDIMPVLIEYANYSSDRENGTIIMDKEVVQGLLLQNLLLKRILAETNPSAAQFLEDLDIILKEIVNLEREDRKTPSLIKDFIHKRDILFKIEFYKDI